MRAKPAVIDGADLAFLELLRFSRGGRMVHEIAKALGVTQAAVRSRARRLRDRDLIYGTRADGFVFYALTEPGKRALRAS